MADQPIEPLLEWLFSLSGPSLKWDIDTAIAFNQRIEDPSSRFPSVHIAGTNGKGSVAAMIHAIAQESGLKAGLFTSPHLVRPEERIRVGEHDISQARFRELILQLRREAEQGLEEHHLSRHPSFFEMVAAAALSHFAEERVDLAVVETGLGGRLDATNIIRPKVTVLTTIALDHVKSLGGDIASIAREKAGIIKTGVPVIAGWIGEEPLEILREVAEQRGAPFHSAADQIEMRLMDNGSFDLDTPRGRYRGLECALDGPHQAANAALAIRAVEELEARKVAFDLQAVPEGLRGTRWAGRLETIESGATFLLDAAHNPQGIDALARHLHLQDRRYGKPQPRILILGLSEGRRPEVMIPPLRGLIDRILLTEARTRKAVEVERLEDGLQEMDLPIECPGTVPETVAYARTLAGVSGEVLVTGSLYLVGDVRQELLGLEGTLHRASERVPPVDAPNDATNDAPNDATVQQP